MISNNLKVCACALALAAAAIGAGTAQATPARTAWAWADQPDATTAYAPDPFYSFNSTGGTMTITPVSTGQYNVAIQGVNSGDPATVQVMAESSIGYCNTLGWDTHRKDVTVAVNCYYFD